MPVIQRGSVLVAGDAADTAHYGSNVALSSDGAIMAVGAELWKGSVSNQGGVYTYDWSGSAWNQRGSVLTASDAASGDSYGSAVSLSDNGTILAVGAPYWEGSVSNQGGVYLYDYSGGVWTQRGGVLYASDAVNTSENFGASVSLSADGSVLVVGSPGQWTNSGRVYTYDWSGSAWVQRGTKLSSSDSSNYFRFGSAVALSGDGSILAASESGRDYGGVFIYDRSGSTWVQRGSALQDTGANNNDAFGSALALSNDGAILAIGANLLNGSAGSQGGVYLYDYVSSAWVQRSLTYASDGGSADYYGSGVALSNSGAVLAVGALGWDGATYTDQGAVYVYDITSGSTVNLTGDASDVAAAGGSLSGPDRLAGAAVDTATAAGELSGGHPYVPISGAAYDSANATGALEAGAVATAPATLTVSYPVATLSAQTKLSVSETATLIASAQLAVLAAGVIPVWTARCILDGVDVSNILVGSASVTADEGAARIASLTIKPGSGTIAPLDYVGKAISLDYVPLIGGVPVYMRLFTGRVDTPHYDPNTQLLALSCVDDLQNRVAALGRPVIDLLVGGRYSTAVQGTLKDNWDYAKSRLSTVAASLDAGPHGGLRLTPWQIASVWATYDAGSLLYQRSSVDYPQRSTLVNLVDISFDYRYPRLRQRYARVGWSGTQIDMAPCGYAYPKQQDILGAANGSGWTCTLGVFWPAPDAIPHPSGGFIHPQDGSIDMAVLCMTQRHIQMVTESYALVVSAPESVAANGILLASLQGALASSFDGLAWESALDVAPLLPEGGEIDCNTPAFQPQFTASISGWIMTVTAVAQGVIRLNMPLSGAGITAGTTVAAFVTGGGGIGTYTVSVPQTVGSESLTGDITRADSDYAIQTLLDQANVKILASHRGARVTNAILCNPGLDVDKKVAFSTAELSAAGKVASVTHNLDFVAGSAITQFSIACFGAGGAGIITPDTLAPPVPPAPAAAKQYWESEIPPLSVNTFGVTAYSDSLMGLLLNPPKSITVDDIPPNGKTQTFNNAWYVTGSYPVTGFRVQMPGVSDADRNPLQLPSIQAFSVVIQPDALTFTIP